MKIQENKQTAKIQIFDLNENETELTPEWTVSNRIMRIWASVLKLRICENSCKCKLLYCCIFMQLHALYQYYWIKAACKDENPKIYIYRKENTFTFPGFFFPFSRQCSTHRDISLEKKIRKRAKTFFYFIRLAPENGAAPIILKSEPWMRSIFAYRNLQRIIFMMFLIMQEFTGDDKSQNVPSHFLWCRYCSFFFSLSIDYALRKKIATI